MKENSDSSEENNKEQKNETKKLEELFKTELELSDEMKNARDEHGNLVYGDSGFISHIFSIEALEKCSTLYMSYHLAIKNNLYKFESFYFDVFKYFDDMLVMRVKRNEEFAPIKNKDGIDSPETALAIYEKKGEWVHGKN